MVFLYQQQQQQILFFVFSIIQVCILNIENLNYVEAFSLSSPSSKSKSKSALTSVRVPATFDVKQVTKVSASDFDVHTHYFHKISTSTNKKDNIYETPVLIENALSTTSCEEICDSMLYNLGNNMVDLQRKRKQKVRDDNVSDDNGNDNGNGNAGTVTETKIYECTLNEALSLMMESKHDDSLFCFSEGLLDTNYSHSDNNNDEDDDDGNNGNINNAQEELQMIKEILTSTREEFFIDTDQRENEQQSQSRVDDSYNLFDFFPQNVKPSDCVVIAGEGATSTLHRDPFCWTGTSLCLEGTKVWRFVAPPKPMGYFEGDGDSFGENDNINDHDNDSGVFYIDNTLEAYRLPSVAWDDGIGSSMVEDPMYLSSGWQSDYSLYSSIKYDNCPSAEELSSMDDEDEKISIIEDIAENMDDLSPNCPTSIKATDDNDNNNGSNQISIWTVVQKPGDLLIIPAYWWHQTYAFEPSIAIASQRCGKERDCGRVLNHMVETSGLVKNNREYPEFTQDRHIQERSMKDTVNELFQFLSKKDT